MAHKPQRHLKPGSAYSHRHRRPPRRAPVRYCIMQCMVPGTARLSVNLTSGGGAPAGARALAGARVQPISPGHQGGRRPTAQCGRAGFRCKAPCSCCGAGKGCALAMSSATQWWVYVGTKADGRTGGRSLPVLSFDSADGSLALVHTDAGHLPAPSWLALAPGADFLYAACRAEDISAAKPTGIGSLDPDDHFVAAFAVDRTTGALRGPISQQHTVNMGPTHLATNGQLVVTAQYGGGGVTAFRIEAEGVLSPATHVIEHTYGSNVRADLDDRDARGPQPRQSAAACHSANFDPRGQRVLIPDLGADRVYVYDVDDASGRLAPATVPYYTAAPGGGPRHFAWHPNGHWCYLITEMGATIDALDYDAGDGSLRPICTVSTLPPSVPPGTQGMTAHVLCSPDGRFVYGSNRATGNAGDHTIAVYRVEQQTGELSYVENTPGVGLSPRNFAISPCGCWMLVA
eukprot:COSAG03_NODE_1985_length_3259_cov_4.704430_2_plen_459_part_00